MPLTKSIALEVAEAEELDRDCSNKYHPQKWRPAVVGTEVIPVVTQPIDPQLLVLKWFLWSRNLLTLYFSRGQTQPLSTIPGVTQPLLLLRNWPMQPFEKRKKNQSAFSENHHKTISFIFYKVWCDSRCLWYYIHILPQLIDDCTQSRVMYLGMGIIIIIFHDMDMIWVLIYYIILHCF